MKLPPPHHRSSIGIHPINTATNHANALATSLNTNVNSFQARYVKDTIHSPKCVTHFGTDSKQEPLLDYAAESEDFTVLGDSPQKNVYTRRSDSNRPPSIQLWSNRKRSPSIQPQPQVKRSKSQSFPLIDNRPFSADHRNCLSTTPASVVSSCISSLSADKSFRNFNDPSSHAIQDNIQLRSLIEDQGRYDTFDNNPPFFNCESSCISGLSEDESHYTPNLLLASQNVTTVQTMDNGLHRHPLHSRTDRDEIEYFESSPSNVSTHRVSLSRSNGTLNELPSQSLPYPTVPTFTKPVILGKSALERKSEEETKTFYPNIRTSSSPLKPSLKPSKYNLNISPPISQRKPRRKMRKRRRTTYKFRKIFPKLLRGMKKALAKSTTSKTCKLERGSGYFT